MLKVTQFFEVQLPKFSSNGAPNEATTIIEGIGDDHVLVDTNPPYLPPCEKNTDRTQFFVGTARGFIM